MRAILVLTLLFVSPFIGLAEEQAPAEATEVQTSEEVVASETEGSEVSAKFQRMRERFERIESDPNATSGDSLDVETPQPSLSKALQGLFLCLGVFFVAVYFMKKFQGGTLEGGGSRLALRDRLNIGPKSSVVVLEVDGQEFLLGVSEGQITTLGNIDSKRVKMKQAPIPLEPSQVVPCIND